MPDNGTFSTVIPGWGTGELVSFVSALVNSNRTITYEAASSVAAQNVTYDQYVLAPESLLDRTYQVSANGTVQISFPQKKEEQHYRVFAFYQKLSGNKNLQFTTSRNESTFDAGSYVVDHFDGRGAETIINFWEEHMLVDGVQERLQRVGHYGESLTTTLMAIWLLPCGFMLQIGRSQWHSVGRQPGASCKHHVVALFACKVSRAIRLRHQAFSPTLHLSAKRLGGTNNRARVFPLYFRHRGPRRQICQRLPYNLGGRLQRVC